MWSRHHHGLPRLRLPDQGQLLGGSDRRTPLEPAAFCLNCGKTYPWTQSRLAAAKELALEAEDLSDEEREQLAGSLDDIVADTPRTQLAISRFKRLMAKAGKGTGQAMREIVAQISTEAAKRAIF
jgi:hypothetical protein